MREREAIRDEVLSNRTNISPAKTPPNPPEYANSNSVLRSVLKVSKTELRRCLGAEKAAKRGSSARVLASRAKPG
jgi:hypothetical protein